MLVWFFLTYVEGKFTESEFLLFWLPWLTFGKSVFFSFSSPDLDNSIKKFSLYMESPNSLYLPRFYGQDKLGLPTKNKITNSVYEMGSIFKSFTVASALNENLVNKDNRVQLNILYYKEKLLKN